MSNLVALLQNTCRRALVPGMTFDNQLRLYRSVIALAREVRLRFGTMPESDIPTLLAEVCEHASAFGLDPTLWLSEATQLQRLAVQLSRAVRHAEATKAPVREICEQHPMHRENPFQAQPLSEKSRQNPMHPENPVQSHLPDVAEDEPLSEKSQQNPLHREAATDDDRLSAWRQDHKTDRDTRAVA